MNWRHPLSETLADIGNDVLTASAASPVVPVSVELTLPLDLRFSAATDSLLGDLPIFRNRTWFDPEPAQLTIVLGEVSHDS